MNKKRILWICNHVTLMDAEVPLLLELGFEVFAPKKFPSKNDFISCKANYEYDASLTIPESDLQLLNGIDFYEDRFSTEQIEVINRNFDIAITAFYENPLKLLVNHFPGVIFIRAFGLAGEANYWDVARESWGEPFLYKMEQIRSRLYFAASYRNMLKVEQNIFRENGVFLPLGLPENFAANLKDGYTGEKKQILFVCPRICVSAYYYGIYEKFKKNFKKFPYVIAGKPFGQISDRHLLGYLPREEFNRVFCESRVMFYHSTEPRHLHYHPLEAIYANQPLIFMSQGMLGELTPKVKYPGAADTIAEAKQKIRRVLNNDSGFIRDVQESQRELLDFFSPQYVKKIWEQNFLPLVSSLPDQSISPAPLPLCKHKTRVGIILPIGYRGGTLNAFISMANMLKTCGYSVTVGIPHDYFETGEYYYPEILNELKAKIDKSISIHVYLWKILTPDQLASFRFLGHFSKKLNPGIKYAIMDDGNNCFCECDRWLFVSDRFTKALPLPMKPYSVVVYDYLQRYLPSNFLPKWLENNYLEIGRQAEQIFVTNQVTGEDAVAYCGIDPRKIFLLPFEFSVQELENYEKKHSTVCAPSKKYFVWACNRGPHKNHVRILQAILKYYQELNGELEIFVTGVETRVLDFREKQVGKNLPKYIEQFRNLFEKNKDLLSKKVHILGEIDRYRYFDLVRRAEFLLLSSLVDNGAFGAVEAAWLGTPCLASDYPHMRYMAKYFGLNIDWYCGKNIDSIANALKNGHKEGYKLPSREQLRACSYEQQHEIIRKTLEEAWML